MSAGVAWGREGDHRRSKLSGKRTHGGCQARGAGGVHAEARLGKRPGWKPGPLSFAAAPSGKAGNGSPEGGTVIPAQSGAPRPFILAVWFCACASEIEELPPIDHGIPITDRRSTFQAHLAPVVCPKQVKMVLAKLYENKKIASATHNIYAYRIYCEDKQTFLQYCEDDGETAAGGRLLHLMEILNVRNVMVVVSRWYGGILLGPDRFKHIDKCARNILVEKNYTNSPEESSKALGKNKKCSSWSNGLSENPRVYTCS
ncbi:protein IMPACT-like [Moschus berezovskii]|uniref:protein IMPACT-like n=1 Tax=Moschus berezovskii TaxID=68408 RepID=UPI002444F2BA|nr:protein IMPACT-like [Moschus berezovskii]